MKVCVRIEVEKSRGLKGQAVQKGQFQVCAISTLPLSSFCYFAVDLK